MFTGRSGAIDRQILTKRKGKEGQPELVEALRDRKEVLKVNGPRVTLAGTQREGASPGCSSL